MYRQEFYKLKFKIATCRLSIEGDLFPYDSESDEKNCVYYETLRGKRIARLFLTIISTRYQQFSPRSNTIFFHEHKCFFCCLDDARMFLLYTFFIHFTGIFCCMFFFHTQVMNHVAILFHKFNEIF